MRKRYWLIFFIGLAILLIGCVGEEPTKGEEGTTEVQTDKEPSELAFKLSEMPEGYKVVERTERTKSDVNEEALGLGWKKGYYVRFANVDKDNMLLVSVIEHKISIYPKENISTIVGLVKGAYEEREEIKTVVELSNPKIGDKSRAYRLNLGGESDKEKHAYVIIFSKKDVYEQLYASGTVTDYELLKELSRKAAKKI